MSYRTKSASALIQLISYLEQSAKFSSEKPQFFPKTQYIRSDWDNTRTKKLNKDTFLDIKNSIVGRSTRVYKGYVAEVVGRDPATGERIYFVDFCGYYYLNCGQYKRF